MTQHTTPDDTGPLETGEADATYIPLSELPKIERLAIPAGEPATVTLGEICRRLGITMTAAFVAEKLHIQPRATEKAAKLYSEADFHRIGRTLIGHIDGVMRNHAEG